MNKYDIEIVYETPSTVTPRILMFLMVLPILGFVLSSFNVWANYHSADSILRFLLIFLVLVNGAGIVWFSYKLINLLANAHKVKLIKERCSFLSAIDIYSSEASFIRIPDVIKKFQNVTPINAWFFWDKKFYPYYAIDFGTDENKTLFIVYTGINDFVTLD